MGFFYSLRDCALKRIEGADLSKEDLYSTTLDGLEMEAGNTGMNYLSGNDIMLFVITISLVIRISSLIAIVVFVSTIEGTSPLL